MFTLCVRSFILDLKVGFGFCKLHSHSLFCHFINKYCCTVAVCLVFLSVKIQVLKCITQNHLTTKENVCFITLTWLYCDHQAKWDEDSPILQIHSIYCVCGMFVLKCFCISDKKKLLTAVFSPCVKSKIIIITSVIWQHFILCLCNVLKSRHSHVTCKVTKSLNL